MSIIALVMASPIISACGSSHHNASPDISISTSISPSPHSSKSTNPTTRSNSADSPSDATTNSNGPTAKNGDNTRTSSGTHAPSSQSDEDKDGTTEGSDSSDGSNGSGGQTSSGSHRTNQASGSINGASEQSDGSGHNANGSSSYTSDGPASHVGGQAASRAAVSSSMPSAGSSSTQGSGQAVRIDIPSIGLHHALVNIGSSGGTVSPEPYQLGIYRGYGRVNPGDPGIAVIAGHVTYYGPDVLYRLSSLGSGTRFTITYANGGTKTFVTTSGPTSIDKNAMQHDARIWGSSSSAVVAIVTCDASSPWLAGHQHHSNNLVVWARPA